MQELPTTKERSRPRPKKGQSAAATAEGRAEVGASDSFGEAWVAKAALQLPQRLTDVRSWHGHAPFAAWCIEYLRPRVFVELGTHKGDSYVAFCQTVEALGMDTACYAVDTWQGDEHSGLYGDEVFDELRRFHDERYGRFSRLVRSTFDDALGQFPDGGIDLLHIDGLHTYEAVQHDFEAWLPKLSERGVVLLHDTNVRERDFGVWRLFDDLSRRYPHFSFLHSHGLGVLAVGERAPDPIRHVRALFARLGDIVMVASERNLLSRQLAEAQSRLAEESDRLSRQVAEAQARLAEERDRLSRELEEAQAALSAQIEALQMDLAERRRRVGLLESDLDWRARSNKDLQHLIALKDNHIRITETALQGRDARIAALLAELASVYGSRSWRMTRPLRAAVGALRKRRRLVRVLRLLYWSVTGRLLKGLRLELAGRRIKRSGLFDPKYYLSQGGNVAQIAVDPIRHYLMHGAEAGRDPNPGFDTSFYVERYPDVAESGLNPLDHYLRIGAREERETVAPPPAEPPATPAGPEPVPWEWYTAVDPKVSIIVIAYNKSEYTIECLRSVWRCTAGVPFEVIVLDNGSEPRHLANVRPHLGPARMIALQTNRGFGEGNNIAVEHARGEHILFLNNDVTVMDGWLVPIVDVIESHPDAGAVGAKLVYPNGTLQEAGAFLRPDGTAFQRGKGDDPERSEYNRLEVVDYCSASALLVRRELFLRVLGFDACYDPAYYEDSDLCLKLEQLGYRTYYCPPTTVIHHEGATSRDAALGQRLHNVVEVNRQKFLARWEERLRLGPRTAPHREPDASVPEAGRTVPERSEADDARRLRVGIFTPFNITPGGGERYLLSIAAVLGSVARVDLIAPHLWSRLRLLTVARELSLDVGDLRPVTIEQARAESPYDLFIAMGNEVAPSVYPLGRRNIFHCQFPFPAGSDYIARQGPWLGRYDQVVVNSDFTRAHFQRQVAYYGLNDTIPVQVISPPVALQAAGPGTKRPMILNVGRFFVHGHNKKQLELVRVFKEMVDRGAPEGWELHLAGSAHPEFEHRAYVLSLLKEAEGYPIQIHVNPPVAQLRQLYADASLYWHATGFDMDEEQHPEQHEHFGITTVEAMSAGCIPIVVATAGQREIVEHGTNGFLWRTLSELKAYTLQLAEEPDAEKIAVLRQKAHERATLFGDNVFRQRILDLAGIQVHPGAPVVLSPQVHFTCNVCGARNTVPSDLIHREKNSCSCGSTVRFRGIVHVLSKALFGSSLKLGEFPTRPEIRGLGMSDWGGYAGKLGERLGYENTFYHQEPRLDILDVAESQHGAYDFLISSDVFEHIAPPVERAFHNAFSLLKPGGFMLLTVPYSLDEETVEHYPELFDYRIVSENGTQRLINRTRDGREQVFENLVFHGGIGATLEMRVFSEKALHAHFKQAGFPRVAIAGDDYAPFGIWWQMDRALPFIGFK
jgi:GT2 family glycosyltransferase